MDKNVLKFLYMILIMLVVIVSVVFGDDKYTLNCDGNICKITKAFGTIGLGNISVD